MSSFGLLFRAEMVKWRKSWTLLTMILAPTCQVGFLAVILWFSDSLVRRFKPGFQFWLEINYLAWNIFFMPIAAVLLSELSWDQETEAKAWTHLLLQPVPRRYHFLVKVLSHASLLLLAQALLLVLVLLGGLILTGNPGLLMGPLPWGTLGRFALYAIPASLPPIALHSWMSTRFPGFGFPLAIAFGGTWISIRLVGSTFPVQFLPWGMSAHMVVVFERWRTLPWGFLPACLLLTGGLIALGTLDFSRQKEPLK
ncbi:MAG TPA: ABC transporter permease [Holophagaceae bacterium]|nr:ABC transporter permease [Holophagaceae bacterium]